MALVGLLIPVLALGFLGSVQRKSAGIPPIHDIATDIVDPPVFSAAVLAARQAIDANPVAAMTALMGSLKAYQGPAFAGIAGKTLGQVGHDAYPAVRPLTLAAAPAKVVAAAEAEAKAQGWTAVKADPAAGVLEATAETFWFGFKDDVAVRIRPSATGGSVVDVRSTSRVGLSDLGANAKRIEAFLAGLKARTAAG
jgi:fatty-acyl-CoA synthase